MDVWIDVKASYGEMFLLLALSQTFVFFLKTKTKCVFNPSNRPAIFWFLQLPLIDLPQQLRQAPSVQDEKADFSWIYLEPLVRESIELLTEMSPPRNYVSAIIGCWEQPKCVLPVLSMSNQS